MLMYSMSETLRPHISLLIRESLFLMRKRIDRDGFLIAIWFARDTDPSLRRMLELLSRMRAKNKMAQCGKHRSLQIYNDNYI